MLRVRLPGIQTHQRDCTNINKDPSDTRKRYSLLNSTTHSDAECKSRRVNEDTNTPKQDEVRSAYIMAEPTPPEEKDFGYAFSTPSTDSQWETDVLPRPHPVSHIDTRNILMKFLLSALTIVVAVCGSVYQGLKGAVHMVKVETMVMLAMVPSACPCW